MDPYSKFREYMITEMVPALGNFIVARAKGASIWDTNGREYVDAFAGIAVTNAGHGRPEILEAARRQMEKFVHSHTFLYPHEPAADLAEQLASVAPGRLKKCFFGSTGAEANEAAMRLARAYTGRTEFIGLYGAFHGRTTALLSVSGNSRRKRRGGPFLPGATVAPAPYLYRSPFPVTEENAPQIYARLLEDVITCATSGDVAAFIAEPVLGEGGIIVPPRGYFKVVKEVLDKYGILFICDEIQTGFNRTGTLFAIEQEGVEPDILTTAKGLANGWPLSAMIARPEIAAAFQPDDFLTTYGGNPVCCAAALATLEVHKKERLGEASRRKGEWLIGELRRRLADAPCVGEVRGRGLMIGIEFVTDRKTKRPAPDIARAVRERARDLGVLVGQGGIYKNVVRIQPPLVITDVQLEQVLDAVCRSVAETSTTGGTT